MTALASLDGRVAVVTGAASGIGRGIAVRLRDAGMTVVAADRDPSVTDVADQIGAEGAVLDITDAAAVEALAADVVARHGRVDLVVNNAGVGPLAPVGDLTVEDYRWTLDINVMGVVHGVKAFLPHLLANPDGGYVVNTSSMAGLIAGPGMTAYSASKYAVVGLTEALAADLAASGADVGACVIVPAIVRSAIGVNALKRPSNADGHAGVGEDDHLPPGRVLEPDDVGDLVVDAVIHGRQYVVTHPEALDLVRSRHRAVEQAFTDAAERELTTSSTCTAAGSSPTTRSAT